VAPWLREAPHVQFTPEMRALSARIVGTETNPYRIAKRCYDWIASNIRYSLAIEYSTIRNISEYCRTRGYGDCGQEALLFITLCRLNGIPARWQSGWNTFPDADDIHDWTEIYLEPYGWVPVDPYMGIWAHQYVRTLGEAERREIQEFYFGGLDQWRMAANRDHCQELRPRKRAARSDPVDFQRGELEWDNRNVYFDRFNYEFTVREIPPDAR
jgi:transglutaminase-like putative cysteine protease